MIFSVRVAADGSVRLDGAERAIIRSRAKLAYDSARAADLPPRFAELSDRIQRAEARRGAARVNPPAQELVMTATGGYQLVLRPPLESELRNAALSLATNLAVAEVLQAHRTGLFRVMAEPDEGAITRLRHTAEGLGIQWPHDAPFAAVERLLDPADPGQATFILAVQRAGQGAGYVPFREGETPWHAAVAATYAHATAPLRRLADRYVVRATLAIADGQPVPQAVAAAFEKLPPVMARAGALGSQLERAALDLAEAVLLQGREGETFAAVATDVDERGARIQLRDYPVVARLPAEGIKAGEHLSVTLVEADLELRKLTFRRLALSAGRSDQSSSQQNTP
jgi:exoribonuclease R